VPKQATEHENRVLLLYTILYGDNYKNFGKCVIMFTKAMSSAP